MDFELSADQIALRDELRHVLTAQCGSNNRKAAAGLPGAIDRGLWKTLADLGVFALCVDEGQGGVGLGRADATVVFEELGRALVPGPVVATFLAAAVIEGAASGGAVVGAVDRGHPLMVEHLEGLDVLLLVDADTVGRADPRTVRGTPMARPLDPLTPVHLVDTIGEAIPAGDA